MFQSNVMTNRAMKRLVILLNMVPRYGIDDTMYHTACYVCEYMYFNVNFYVLQFSKNLNHRLLQQPLIYSTLL